MVKNEKKRREREGSREKGRKRFVKGKKRLSEMR